jgi:hypothetical protein
MGRLTIELKIGIASIIRLHCSDCYGLIRHLSPILPQFNVTCNHIVPTLAWHLLGNAFHHSHTNSNFENMLVWLSTHIFQFRKCCVMFGETS